MQRAFFLLPATSDLVVDQEEARQTKGMMWMPPRADLIPAEGPGSASNGQAAYPVSGSVTHLQCACNDAPTVRRSSSAVVTCPCRTQARASPSARAAAGLASLWRGGLHGAVKGPPPQRDVGGRERHKTKEVIMENTKINARRWRE